MKASNRFIAMLLVLFGTASCEKTITVDIPEEKGKIVVNSYSRTGDTIVVKISKSEPILKYRYNKDLTINNAVVVLYANGVAADTLQYDAVNRLYISSIVAEPGKKYAITVNAPGFDEATAESVAPAVVNISAVSRNFKTRTNEIGEEQDEIKIEFDDPQTGDDYYVIKILVSGDSSDTYHCVNTADASVEDIYNEGIDPNTCISSAGIFLTDDLFNGNRKELRLYMLHYLLQSDTTSAYGVIPKVQLLHVTKEHYNYEKSYQYGAENSGNPFAEPVNVYTNVKNGYGMFSIVSEDTEEIR